MKKHEREALRRARDGDLAVSVLRAFFGDSSVAYIVISDDNLTIDGDAPISGAQRRLLLRLDRDARLARGECASCSHRKSVHAARLDGTLTCTVCQCTEWKAMT